MLSRQLYVPLTLLLMSSAAQAFDLDEDSGRHLADPSYLPAQGELDGESTLSYSHNDGSHHLKTGAISPKRKADSDSVTQRFDLGLSDRIRIGVSEEYAREYSTEVYANATDRFDHAGMQDPVFNLRARAVAQSSSPVYLDLEGLYSPNLFPSRVATLGTTGTVARGNQMFGASAFIGREMKALTSQLGLQAQYYGKGESKIAGGTGDREFGSFLSYGLSLDNQLRFDGPYFINAGIGIAETRAHSVKINQPSYSATPYTVSYGPSESVYLSPGYQLIPDSLTVNTEVAWAHLGTVEERHNTYSDQWSSRQQLYLGLKLHYVIF